MKKILTIIIVLAIIVVWYMVFIKKLTQDTAQQTPTPTSLINRGIIIQSPRANEVVQLPITVIGYVNDNGWNGFEGEVGSVQVLDRNGKAVSGIEPLTATTDWMKPPVYFKVQVGDRQMMSYLETTTGTLLFKSSVVKDGEVPKEFRLPIKFK